MSYCGQPVPTSTKWVLTLIFCIIVTRNGLNTKRSLHSRLNFMFLVKLLIYLWLVMTCVIPSQMAYSFIISNASHSMHCSSVEACLLWKCCSVANRIVEYLLSVLISDNRILVISIKCDAQPNCMGYFTCDNNCGRKCSKRLFKQNSSYSDYFNAISGLYRTAEPQEALWHYLAPNFVAGGNNCQI